MAEPFVAEIRYFAFTFAPKNFALCNGQLLPINQNQALFSLLGVNYGGNGQTTFGLPDLRGRIALGADANTTQGQVGGAESVTLTTATIPPHTHTQTGAVRALASNATIASPSGAVPAGEALNQTNIYSTATPNAALGAVLPSVGGNAAHENRPPFLTLNFSIALNGVFPSRD